MFNLLSKVRDVNPLVLHYTNEVTINDCANITLALGASPLMSYSYEELEEIIPLASSVVINIGTMNSSYIDLFLKAGKIANKFNKPVVLDPVGVFATKSRALLVEKLINEVKFDVIKGNFSEIKYIGAASMGILTMSLCGELADKGNIGIGSFKVSLMDNIYNLNKETLNKFSRVEVF